MTTISFRRGKWYVEYGFGPFEFATGADVIAFLAARPIIARGTGVRS